MTLRWEEQAGGGWYAMRGQRIVGMVTARDDGVVVYHVTAVHTKWVTKGYGEVKTVATAKRALERAWRDWLDAFELQPIEKLESKP